MLLEKFHKQVILIQNSNYQTMVINMFVVYKAVASILMPPGIFVLLGLIATFIALKNFIQADFYNRRSHFGVLIILLIITSGLYIISIEPITNKIILPLENKYPALNKQQLDDADSIIVLGGGIHSNSPLSFSEERSAQRGFPSRVAQARLIESFRIYNYAKKYYNKHMTIILCGGALYAHQTPEAQIDKNFLTDLGVPANDIIFDDTSRTTGENAENCIKLLESKKLKKPLLVTSAMHMPRSIFSFRMAGIYPIPAPADYQRYSLHQNASEYFPQASAFMVSCQGIWERLGIYWYKIRYFKKAGLFK